MTLAGAKRIGRDIGRVQLCRYAFTWCTKQLPACNRIACCYNELYRQNPCIVYKSPSFTLYLPGGSVSQFVGLHVPKEFLAVTGVTIAVK